MENIPIFYLLFVLAGCVLAMIAVWSRRGIKMRLTAILALIAITVLNYGALISLLGRPQPFGSFAGSTLDRDVVVLAVSIAEGHGIYLWLRHPQEHQPRYYEMKWSHEKAAALKQAMNRSTRENTTLMMNHDYETSLEIGKEPLFYTMPHERLPLKPLPEVFEYRNPNTPT